MIHLRSIALAVERETGFPFSIPAIRELGVLSLSQPASFLVGENGSGKSTLLEALAWATESVVAGSTSVELDSTLESVEPLGRALQIVWNKRTRRGFFLRAEDFFGYVKHVKQTLQHMDGEVGRLRAENPDLPEGELTRITGPYAGSAGALRSRYGENMDGRSHGEQFLSFFQSRLVPGGLYLLDEPEAPLSPARQLSLLSILKEATEQRDCQFIIATHSPILMALPDAAIFTFDELPVRQVAYDELEHVRLTRDFLNRPEAFTKHL